MTSARSALRDRASRTVMAAFGLLVAGVLGSIAIAAPSTRTPTQPVTVSLEQSSSAVPLDGTMGFTGVIRFAEAASSVQARIQVHLPSGRLVYQRTQYLTTAEEGTKTFSFSRQLDGLGLDAGVYPATFSVYATVAGSDIATEVTVPLRVYDAEKPPVKVALIAKVHAVPMVSPDGGFAVDPSSPAATSARDAVDAISRLVLADPLARMTLAIAPSTLEEWRRIATSGYTLGDGPAIPQTDPVPAAYATALQDLQTAVTTTRLELVSLGYSDPSLADLSQHRLESDAAVQYDAGISACFASLQTTPSASTAPAGGCVPDTMQAAVAQRGVRTVVSDGTVTRLGRQPAQSGAYPIAGGKLTALVVDGSASRGLESGDASATLTRTFARLTASSASQPFAVRIDLEGTGMDATSTVDRAVSALETSPWTQLACARDLTAPKGAKTVRFAPEGTKSAPKGFWTQVRTARADATGLLAVLTASDDQATAAQTQSLYAESSAWAGSSATWEGAARGLSFAKAAEQSARKIFSKVHISAEPVTLAGSTGEVPVNVQNGSGKTLAAVVVCKASRGIKVSGSRQIPTTLAPGETFVSIPIDMGSILSGQLTVQVMAGSVTVARQVVEVRHSYLDRLVLIGGIVLVLAGMLVWIVLRVRAAQNVEAPDADTDIDAENESERYTDSDSETKV